MVIGRYIVYRMTQNLFFYCELLGWFHEDKLTDPPTGCTERYLTWRGLTVRALQNICSTKFVVVGPEIILLEVLNIVRMDLALAVF